MTESRNQEASIDLSSALRWLRPIAGAAILGVLAWRLGAEPFVAGLRDTSPAALLAALVVTAGTTWCCAQRWSLLASRLDVAITTGEAYRACYRSQFLNATLPSGIVGDVHRGYRHGRDTGALGRGLRSVAWDRGTGQAVQIGLTLPALLLLPTAARGWIAWPLAVVACLLVAAGLVVRRTRAWVPAAAEVRRVVGERSVAIRVVALSALAVAGHLLVFLLAVHVVGIDVPIHDMIAIGAGVLLASAVPLNVAGWGPREGAAAGLFAASGLGADTGLHVAVVYGVMALVATVPGALVLHRPMLHRPTPRPDAIRCVGADDAEGGPTWVNVPTRS